MWLGRYTSQPPKSPPPSVQVAHTFHTDDGDSIWLSFQPHPQMHTCQHNYCELCVLGQAGPRIDPFCTTCSINLCVRVEKGERWSCSKYHSTKNLKEEVCTPVFYSPTSTNQKPQLAEEKSSIYQKPIVNSSQAATTLPQPLSSESVSLATTSSHCRHSTAHP